MGPMNVRRTGLHDKYVNVTLNSSLQKTMTNKRLSKRHKITNNIANYIASYSYVWRIRIAICGSVASCQSGNIWLYVVISGSRALLLTVAKLK